MIQFEQFSVGDTVKRPVHIYAESGLHRRGVVTRCYDDEHHDVPLYEVEWREEGGKPLDPPLVLKGYLPWGLDRV